MTKVKIQPPTLNSRTDNMFCNQAKNVGLHAFLILQLNYSRSYEMAKKN